MKAPVTQWRLVLLLEGWCQYKRMGYGNGTGALISKTEIKTTCPEI